MAGMFTFLFLCTYVVVEPERDAESAETGSYMVTIGEGWWLADRLLAKCKVIAKDAQVRCMAPVL